MQGRFVVTSIFGDIMFSHIEMDNTPQNTLRKMIEAGIDLSFADLRKWDLSGFNFTGIDLSGVDFTKADLSEADFTNANLSGTDFTFADLYNAKLDGANVFCTKWTGTDLRGINILKTVNHK